MLRLRFLNLSRMYHLGFGIKTGSKRWLCSVLFCLTLFGGFSQNTLRYIWPIDSPFVITGNYGELRPNHFHAGIDFSTQGQINLPVYAIEEGYVSRIRVSPYGYGKCVYITHPNGKVSVYAHLNAFSLKIAAQAKENQYATQSFEIDFLLKPRLVYVRKNEIIGLSGNTGGSTGPHLHFEIRDELTEVPLNPLSFFKINDRTPPQLQHIALYDLADTTSPKFLRAFKVKENGKDSSRLDNDRILVNRSILGISFVGLDRVSVNGNPNNVYSAKLYLDDTLIYAHRLQGISFSDSRYINAFSEIISKHKYQKCFLPTLYPDGFAEVDKNKGRIVLSDHKFHSVKLVTADESGNERKLQFYLKAERFTAYNPIVVNDAFVNCNEDRVLIHDQVKIQITARTLFYSSALIIENNLETQGRLSVLPDLSLKQAVLIGFVPPQKFSTMAGKLLLKGSSSTATAVVRNDSVYFAVKEFGRFKLALDTVPPGIKIPYSPRQLKDAWKMDSFSFSIIDGNSGIGRYNLWLNNAWVLSEYDAKTDLLTYYFDEDTPIGILNFKLEVQDKVGNKTFLEYVLKK